MVAVPPAASAAGYTSLVFNDDFTNPNDIAPSGTTTSGYNWYWSFSVGSFITPDSWSIDPTETAAQVNNGNSGGGDNASPNGGILHLDSVRGSTPGWWGNSTITTIPYNISSVPSQGAWQYGYFEAYVQYNPDALGSNHPQSDGFPAFWSWGAEGAHNFGDWQSPLNSTVTEADFLEDFSGVTWASGGTDPVGSENGTIMNPAGQTAAYAAHYPTSDSNWHTIGFLWTPTTISFYRDNVLIGSHSTAGWYLDSEHLFMVLGTGIGWPMNVDWVHVWQGSTTPPPTAPVISAIAASPGSGDLTTGAVVTLTVTFSAAVTVAGGTPTLTLNDGGTATYSSGSGSDSLVFTYTVAAGQNTADLALAATNAVVLNGATIQDASGDNAVLTAANGYGLTGTLQIDTTAPAAPVITGGTSSALSGTGEAGATVTILNGSTSVGTATVGSNGNWSWSFSVGTSQQTLTARQTDGAGQSPISSETVLIGTNRADTLTSTGNNDLMIGEGGADTFWFGPAFGVDMIADFAASGGGHDIIDFHRSQTLRSFANVMSHATQVGSGVVITQDANDTVTLNNVSRSSLTSADFRFA